MAITTTERNGHLIEIDWSPAVDLKDGEVTLYRRWRFNSRGEWMPAGLPGWEKIGTVCIVGLWAGPAYWFKTMEARVKIATTFLQQEALKKDARKFKQRELEEIGEAAIH